MRSTWHRALLVSFLLIMSSLAGCLGGDEDESDEGTYGTVMVSTYHIGEIVKAITGDSVNVEMMSTENIPVHDYEPSLNDIVRLSDADLFLYHGLGLEPWVESTLSSLGDDAPPSYMTHAMPTGESDLAYESMLVSNLCELMTDGPFESTTLGMMSDDHDDHGDDDHDDHGDDDHDDHDAHEHAEAEMTFENPEACPADTTIQVFHMEAGEHILEFESEHDEDFNMAVLKMLGGHAHHDHHGHGSGPFEWAGIFEMNDATHTWSMQKVDGDYADPTMRLVLIPTDTPTEETMHGLESGVEALIEGDCTVVEDGETMTSIAAEGSCFELHVGTSDDSTFTIDTTGITGMSMYAQHVPTEFERDQHYLKDSAGTDIEPIAQEGAGAHGDHGDHGDEHGDDHDDHDDEMCHNTETHENYDSTEEECEAAGHMWTGDDDHGDDHGDEMCHDEETHENYESTEEECEAAGDMWLGHEEHVLPEIHAELVAHTLSFFEAISIEGEWIDEWNSSQIIDSDSWNSNTITQYDNDEMWAVAENGANNAWSKYDWTWNSEELYYCQSTFAAETEADALSADSANATDLDTGCGGFPWSQMDHAHDDHDDHDEMVCYDMNTHTVNMSLTTESDCQAAGLMWTAANSGPGGDDHSDEEEHHGMGAVVIHIEAEGDYGFVLPNDIHMYIVMGEGGHDDHDDHDDHGDDDHDDHGDDDHDDDGDEIVAGDDEDAFTYDPHSWLSPIAFEAQVNVVLASLSSTFPNGSAAFTENAASYSVQLMDLHERFMAAFGEDGTCDMAGQDKTIVANHNAYSYMSVQYDIDIITLHGLDPEGEPSPADIAEVVESIEEKGITVLFVEEYTDQTAVNSIVEQTGVSLEILYTMEMAPSDSTDNYLSMMNKNLENIISGCGC